MKMNSDILFYDGECGLCSRIVQFILMNEKAKNIKFCSLQSEKAHQILKQYSVDLPINNFETIYFISSDKLYSKSTAVLKIVEFLKVRFLILKLGWLLPQFVRDKIYNWISLNRHKWKMNTCQMITEENKSRFLE